MKKLTTTMMICAGLLATIATFAQPTPNISDTAKHPPLSSPRDSIVGMTEKGVTITMTYGSPAIKGRTMGTNLDPMEDSVWRAGANEATTFAVDKDVMVEGKKLPAGRYALFAKKHGSEWTFIFNKVWQTWGAYSYKQNMAQDALLVKVKQLDIKTYDERLKYIIAPDGKVYMVWGTVAVAFSVK